MTTRSADSEVSKQDSASPSSDAEAKADSPSTPAGGRSAAELRDVADSLRTRVDAFGKALAAIATIGTTVVGLTKTPDLFPAAGKWGWLWVTLACVGLAAAALAAIAVAARLMNVAGPVLMTDDLENNDDLDQGEKQEVEPIFRAAAKRYGYTSVAALRGRERSLRDAASKAIDSGERARRKALADEVNTEIEQAFARSSVVVVRRRASNAVTDWSAFALYSAAIVGLILFLLGTDKVSSAPSRISINDAKACGEAAKAKATPDELEKTRVCDKERPASTAPATPKAPSSAAAKAQAIAKLTVALETCTALVDSGSSLDCDPIRTAIVAMASP